MSTCKKAILVRHPITSQIKNPNREWEKITSEEYGLFRIYDFEIVNQDQFKVYYTDSVLGVKCERFFTFTEDTFNHNFMIMNDETDQTQT